MGHGRTHSCAYACVAPLRGFKMIRVGCAPVGLVALKLACHATVRRIIVRANVLRLDIRAKSLISRDYGRCDLADEGSSSTTEALRLHADAWGPPDAGGLRGGVSRCRSGFEIAAWH